ncbi:MAG: ATP-binding protein [Candidatus Thiodiazotropha lotti]|nr:ATP-binding protein [Candidatus Thiodiazotropha lotti]
MSSIFYRSIAIIVPILIIWYLLVSLLHDYVNFYPVQNQGAIEFSIVREKLSQRISQSDNIDYEEIRNIADEFDMSVNIVSKELVLNGPELSEIESAGFLEFYDEKNRYAQLMHVEGADILIEITSDDWSLKKDYLLDFVSLFLLLLLSVAGLLLATKPYERQLTDIHRNLLILNRKGRVEPLNNTQPGYPGDIARELDTLTDNINNLVESRTSLLVAHQDLLHGVAHEFRSPMARLNFAVEMLSTAESYADTKTLYEDICNALDEMELLVKEVLQYSRLQQGDKSGEYSTVSIAELVKAVIEKQKSISPEITISSEGEDLEIEVIEYLIERAIVNLLRNACYFARQKVLISWQRHTNDIEIRVADDGIGIPPGKREQIFEPFTRLDPSRSRESGGIGLGLSIAKSICTNHHGTISAGESQLGGAEFRIRIPISYQVSEQS